MGSGGLSIGDGVGKGDDVSVGLSWGSFVRSGLISGRLGSDEGVIDGIGVSVG